MTYGTYEATHDDLALHSGEDISIYFPFSTNFYTTLSVSCYSFIFVIYFCSKVIKTDHVLM